MGPPHDPPTILMPQSSEIASPGEVRADAGLAPGMPPVIAFSGEEAMFEQRMSAVLAGTIEGLQFDLADFYLLDDRTAELRIAASTGSTKARPRGIEEAAGDLTAMAGEAVVLEDQELMGEFDVPRKCGAAVCVPVASDRTIHGSLWLYCRRSRPISNPELQLVEIVAGRLAVEVERRELLKPSPATIRGQAARVEASELLLPEDPLKLNELEIAGRLEGSGALYDWHALRDGRVLTYAGAFVGAPGVGSNESGLTLQAARIALRSHAEGATHAGRLLNRVAETLSEAAQGGAGVSLAAALIDPDTGEGSYALAGAAVALRIRASQQQHEVTEDPPVGWDAEQAHCAASFELEIRERLLLAVGDPRRLDHRAGRRLTKAFSKVSADDHRRMSAWDALDLLQKHSLRIGSNLEAAIALRRK